MEYKGYRASVTYDDSCDLLHASVVNSGYSIASSEASDLQSLKREEGPPQAWSRPSPRALRGGERRRSDCERLGEAGGQRNADTQAVLSKGVLGVHRVQPQPGRSHPSQLQRARPMISSLSPSESHGSSSVNMVTHWLQGQGIRVMSVPQKSRSGPKASYS